MQGGLLKSASAVAILAAAGLFGASPAKAADLGGDCCADLEERVAELEASTVRKGNRKVSLTISGFVGHTVLWWNDGTQSDVYIGDTGNITSRWRFTGSAKISPALTAGFTYEFAATSNAVGSGNQLNGGDDLGASAACNGGGNNNSGCTHLRDSTVWLRHKQLGMVKIGYGSTATDNLVLIDVGRMGVAGTPDHGLHVGGYMLRSNAGLLGSAANINWANSIRGHESWDTSRRNHVLYETPSLAGFTLQAAVAEDNFWDVALRYAGEFAGFRVAGGLGYQEDSEFNAANQIGAGTIGVLCTTNCNVKTQELKGSLSVMHVPTGLFVTGSAGNREISGIGATNQAYTGPDLRYWHLAAGISQNFFGIGNTVLFGEYGEHKGGMAQQAFLGTIANHCFNSTAAQSCDNTVTNWGIGLVQYVDAAAMELFATYKNYAYDGNGFTGGNLTLNSNAVGVHDMQIFMVGTKINF